MPLNKKSYIAKIQKTARCLVFILKSNKEVEYIIIKPLEGVRGRVKGET